MGIANGINLPEQDGYAGIKLDDMDYSVFLVNNGNIVDLLPHKKHHSDAMSWGYAGSGPADLARSILADVVGNEVLDHPEIYQKFKFEFVAGLGEIWFISKQSVIDWMEQNFPR